VGGEAAGRVDKGRMRAFEVNDEGELELSLV